MDTFQLLSGRLKDSAPANINSISLTLDTFHLLSGWLKEPELQNIPCIICMCISTETAPKNGFQKLLVQIR